MTQDNSSAKIIKYIKNIESKKEIVLAAKVLKELELKNLKQPYIASGFIRGFLTKTLPSDIDIAYVGKVHFKDAQSLLSQVLNELKIKTNNWDVKGIWNAQIDNPQVNSTEKNYLLFYVDSIDSVYLASDGKLHDPTGFGFKDSLNKTLRMNNFLKNGFNYKVKEIVYFCLEGCRRIAKFGWKPTTRSIDLIKYGLPLWQKLRDEEKEYFYKKKILSKYKSEEFSKAKEIYDKYGWGFIFDKAKKYSDKMNYVE